MPPNPSGWVQIYHGAKPEAQTEKAVRWFTSYVLGAAAAVSFATACWADAARDFERRRARAADNAALVMVCSLLDSLQLLPEYEHK